MDAPKPLCDLTPPPALPGPGLLPNLGYIWSLRPATWGSCVVQPGKKTVQDPELGDHQALPPRSFAVRLWEGRGLMTLSVQSCREHCPRSAVVMLSLQQVQCSHPEFHLMGQRPLPWMPPHSSTLHQATAVLPCKVGATPVSIYTVQWPVPEPQPREEMLACFTPVPGM
jgi:hypothetical protein